MGGSGKLRRGNMRMYVAHHKKIGKKKKEDTGETPS